MFRSKTGIRYILLSILGMFLCLGEVLGQSNMESLSGGYPFIQSFSAREYNAEAQNWAVVQAANGLIYVGNNHGVLEFDGVQWRLIRLPLKSVVRSLVRHHDGQIYVSSNGDIGVLKPDSLGLTSFHSLLGLLPPSEQEVGEVLNVVSLPDGVYFQALDRLIRIQGDAQTTWYFPDLAEAAFAANERVYISVPNNGLLQLENNALVTAPGGETFKGHRIAGVFALDEESFLVVTQQHGMFSCDYALSSDETCTVFRPAASEILASLLPYNALKLEDGSFLISTYGNGLVFMTPDGELSHRLTEEDGLNSNSVTGFEVDRENGLWLATANGVNRLSLKPSMTYFDESVGYGNVVTGDMLRYKDTLYVASFEGVHALRPGAQAFTKELFIQDQCPALLPTQHGLLAGCRNGIYNVDKKRKVETPEGITTYNLFQPSWDSTRIYLALRDGLAWLELRGKEWHFVDRLDVQIGAYKILEDRDGRIWMSTIRDGIYLLEFEPDQQKVDLKQFGPTHGVPPGLIIADKLAGDVVFKAWDGSGLLLKPVSEVDSISFVPHEVYAQIPEPFEQRILNYAEDDEGWIWIFNREQSVVAIPQPDGNYLYKATSLRTANVYNAYSMYVDDNGVLWVASTEGMVRLEKEFAISPGYQYSALIRQVTTLDNRLLHGGENTSSVHTYVWPDSTNNLRFSFSAPQYDAPGLTLYRTRLQGMERTWSAWSHETNRDFTNLSEGTYTFRAQARNAYGTISQEASLTFEILPPWYRTAWASLLWAAAGLGLFGIGLWAINGIQTRRLQARNKLLNHLVDEKTEEIRGKNALLSDAYYEVQSMNDNLTRSNKSLQERTDRLREALETNKEILGITAHDLKNPLGGIIGLAEMVLLDTEEHQAVSKESVLENVALLKEEAERMLHIVKSLLDKHREGEKISLSKEEANLQDIIASVIRWNEQQAHNKQIQLHHLLEEPVMVEVDVVSIQRVLDNYVSNAIKYSPRETSVWIDVSMDDDSDKAVRISVRDEGPGLTHEDKTKVFGEMQRLSAKPTGDEHSSGLGLYIVKKLVEAHGGVVGVNSEVGQGATFWMELPVCNLLAES